MYIGGLCSSASEIKREGKKRKINPKKSLKRESEFRYWLACKILVGRSHIYNVVTTSPRAQFFVLDSSPPSPYSPSRTPVVARRPDGPFFPVHSAAATLVRLPPPSSHRFCCSAKITFYPSFLLLSSQFLQVRLVFGFFFRLRVSSTYI